MRWFSRFGCLNNTRIGLKHRIFFALSVITTRIGQFEDIRLTSKGQCPGDQARYHFVAPPGQHEQHRGQGHTCR